MNSDRDLFEKITLENEALKRTIEVLKLENEALKRKNEADSLILIKELRVLEAQLRKFVRSYRDRSGELNRMPDDTTVEEK